MCRSTFLLVIFTTASVYCRNVVSDDFKDVVPGHLEYDAEFQRRFPYIQPNVDTRIVGGIEVTPHSRPYQVGIIVPVSVGGSYFCGASLIDTMNIITAAHCVDYLVGNLTAYLGAHNMLPAASENALVVQTDDVVVYPGWDRSVLMNDIAIIRLKEPVQLTARINTVLLPRDNTQDYLGNSSLVTGWGRRIEFTPGISPVLNELSSHIMSNYACRLAYMGYVEDSNICMASYIGRATCSGDSGGPLTVNGVQVGVVSFGSGWGCAQGFPSVFARITHYLDWISENLAPIPETTTTTSTTTESTTSATTPIDTITTTTAEPTTSSAETTTSSASETSTAGTTADVSSTSEGATSPTGISSESSTSETSTSSSSETSTSSSSETSTSSTSETSTSSISETSTSSTSEMPTTGTTADVSSTSQVATSPTGISSESSTESSTSTTTVSSRR